MIIADANGVKVLPDSTRLDNKTEASILACDYDAGDIDLTTVMLRALLLDPTGAVAKLAFDTIIEDLVETIKERQL